MQSNQTQDDDPAIATSSETKTDHAHDDVSAIATSIRRQLQTQEPQDWDQLRVRSGILRDTTESEKHRAEIADLGNRSESLRFWVPILAPTLSAIALVATLLIQTAQFRTNMRYQQHAAETAAWQALLRDLTTSDKARTPFALQQLRGFLTSEQYSENAREVSATLLRDVAGTADFEGVFAEILQKTDLTNLESLARVLRGLDDATVQLVADIASLDRKIAIAQNSTELSNDARLRELTDLERQRVAADVKRHTAINQSRLVTRGIATFVRKHSASRGDRRLPFDGVYLREGDFSSVSLDHLHLRGGGIYGGNIAKSSVSNSDVADAILIPDYWQGSSWSGTAWWRAAEVKRDLLQYLKQNYPFNPAVAYSETMNETEQDYRRELARLEAVKPVA